MPGNRWRSRPESQPDHLLPDLSAKQDMLVTGAAVSTPYAGHALRLGAETVKERYGRRQVHAMERGDCRGGAGRQAAASVVPLGIRRSGRRHR
jgi:hypothetical protein